MKTKLKMIYWKGKKFWVGKLVDHPEIMSQGETLRELEENLVDAYRLMLLDDVPQDHETKEIVLAVPNKAVKREEGTKVVYVSENGALVRPAGISGGTRCVRHPAGAPDHGCHRSAAGGCRAADPGAG